VFTEYDDPELRENPPVKVDFDKVRTNGNTMSSNGLFNENVNNVACRRRWRVIDRLRCVLSRIPTISQREMFTCKSDETFDVAIDKHHCVCVCVCVFPICQSDDSFVFMFVCFKYVDMATDDDRRVSSLLSYDTCRTNAYLFAVESYDSR
jgi:hypothetical protein